MNKTLLFLLLLISACREGSQEASDYLDKEWQEHKKVNDTLLMYQDSADYYELKYWENKRDSGDPKLRKFYVEQNGRFRELMRIEFLQEQKRIKK